MDHALENSDSSLDSRAVHSTESGYDIAGTVIYVTYRIYCCDRSDLHKIVSAGKGSETCLHGSAVAHIFADARTGSGTVVA